MRLSRSHLGLPALAAGFLTLAPAAAEMPTPGDPGASVLPWTHARPAPGGVGPTEPGVADSTGAARFPIPIAVPPGPGGFAPNLELAYSSRSGDGPYGVGWSIGIPEIRCSARFGVPDFANCAHYELGGVLLVEDPATADEYHTLVESFQRIRYVPAGDSWTVEQPNGTQLIFGEQPDHRIAQGGSTARWLLERMEDAFGNKIFFEYDTLTDTGSAYPASVFYGADASQAAGPREVRFVYEERPDARHDFSGGIERKLTQRLREIQIFGHEAIFRRYVFGYALPDVVYTTDRSRLSWVQEFGTDCTDLGANPVESCTGLPRREFRYRDAHDVSSSGTGSQWDGDNDDYRTWFGTYTDTSLSYDQFITFPGPIGDIDGDGLPDRLLPRFLSKWDPPVMVQVGLNTGSGFVGSGGSDLALDYEQSFAGLTYDQPRLQYRLIPAPIPGGMAEQGGWNLETMYAMCSVERTTRVATLSQELLQRGIGAATSTTDDLDELNFFEPRPSVKLVDLDADGLADLVLSVRVSSVTRHFDCNGEELDPPEDFPGETTSVVFRNTGSGWVNDQAAQALAAGLPPFEEVIVRSTYQTELDEPSFFVVNRDGERGEEDASSPCANLGYSGWEQTNHGFWDLPVPVVCHVPIDLSPQFVDFNGDGYLDLAVLQRDDPDRLWTGDGSWGPFGHWGYNKARTRVWIQEPNGSTRWARAPQYDLPLDIWPSPSVGGTGFAHVNLVHWFWPEDWGVNCYSWMPHQSGDFADCGPSTYRRDSGVRLADLNGDGLTDVVWRGGDAGAGAAGGVLLNTGAGSDPFSAWCASDSDDANLVGGACPEAAAYVPPHELVLYENVAGAYSHLGRQTGMFADLNGDGFLDFVRLRIHYDHPAPESWIQSPGGATPTSVWQRDERFDFPIDWGTGVEHPSESHTVYFGQHPALLWFTPGYQAFDIDGDGSADLAGDQYAFLSKSRHSDLIRSVDNGRGGLVEVEYDSMVWQRDASLEEAAELDAQQPETPEGGDATLWRPRPVVSRVSVTGPDFAEAVTEYRYARPRFSREHRSDLGFRLVEQTRADASTVEQYVYQDHGRAGRTSKRLVKDAGEAVHRYLASWELVTGSIPGSISEVFLGRLVWEKTWNEYAGEAGALLERTLTYDDVHGYNFVSEIETERPTGILVDAREPDSDFGSYVIGRNARRTLTDAAETILRDTIFTYLDLDNDPTGPKLGSRSELVAERGAPGGNWVDVVELRYDGYGNLIEERTPSPAGGTRSTLHCYDGDIGWCQSESPSGHSSHSVRVATQDPLGMVTRMTPDPRSGILVGLDSDYTDEAATRTELDPFGRPQREYVTPTGGDEVLVAENAYDDASGPLRVERLQYVNGGPEGDSIYSAQIFGAFGGLWKAIEETPSGYVGAMAFSDPAARRVRTTLPLDCGQDATCGAFSGQTQAFAREVESDALGRPIRIDTPDGFSLLAYGRVAGQWGSGALDAVLEKNAKGDLSQRALDGDRPVWVDECHVGVGAGLETLEGVTCGLADTTRYTYEATGEIETVYDARAVEGSSFDDPDQRLRYAHDTLGRVLRIEDPDLAGTGSQLTTYHDAGTVASTTNARNETRSYAYDVLGRLTGVTTPADERDYTVSYRPSEWQREKDASGVYERLRTYDGWGRVTQTQLSVREGDWPFSAYLMDFEYDVAGRLLEVVYPESTTVRYEYDGAYLERVCDLGTAQDCSDSGSVAVVGDVTYDALGRRAITETAAGTRTFSYDGSLSRLLTDRFDASSDPYWVERNYSGYDELGNVTTISGSSEPGDIDLDESYTYDSRNRLASWTKGGETQAYGYDELGNLTTHAGVSQAFDDASRPHAIQSRGDGDAAYAYDEDGNVTSILGPGSTRYFQFDSANRLVCVGPVAGGCGVSRIHYDVDGRRVFDDKPGDFKYLVYVDDSVRVSRSLEIQTRIEIRAFGERIAYKTSTEALRAARLVPFCLPPGTLPWLACLGSLGLAGLLAWAARRGTLVLVIERPCQAGVSSVLVVALLCLPLPPPARAGGGGGGSSLYWEFADRQGTGMVMLDESGARLVHRTYTPFGMEHASAGTGGWLPGHYAGHLEDEDSGLVYMQARWYDAEAGVFLSVDPVVASSGDPQSYNAYAYARNNPISKIDPTGMWQFDCFGSCGAPAGAPPGWVTFDNVSWATLSVQSGPMAGASVTKLMPTQTALHAAFDVLSIGGMASINGQGLSLGESVGGLSGSGSSRTGATGLQGLLADATDPGVVTDVPTLEGKTFEAAMDAGGQTSTHDLNVLGDLSHALQRGNIMHAIELLKVAATPGIVTGLGVSKILIGAAIMGGLLVGTGGVGVWIAGGALLMTGYFEVDAGLMLSNQILGTRISVGPLSSMGRGNGR